MVTIHYGTVCLTFRWNILLSFLPTRLYGVMAPRFQIYAFTISLRPDAQKNDTKKITNSEIPKFDLATFLFCSQIYTAGKLSVTPSGVDIKTNNWLSPSRVGVVERNNLRHSWEPTFRCRHCSAALPRGSICTGEKIFRAKRPSVPLDCLHVLNNAILNNAIRCDESLK
jgi:hypothetical protein